MEGDFLLVVVVVVALGFDFTNGFHDTANAVATSISTRALSPRLAVAVASVANLVGAFVTTAVATTVGSGVLETEPRDHARPCSPALFGAIAWNLFTWWLGLPSSSSHALIGGLVGAGIAAAGLDGVQWHTLAHKVIIPAFIAPTIAFAAAFVLLVAIFWVFQRMPSSPANRMFRIGQLFSGTFVAFTHGANDAQKTMGVIALALLANGSIDTFYIPTWVKISAGVAIAAGTYVGGWRIMRTLGQRLYKMEPPAGFSVAAHRRRRDRRRDAPRLSALDHARDLGRGARLRLDAPLPGRALGDRREHRRRVVPDNAGGGPGRRRAVLARPGDLLAGPRRAASLDLLQRLLGRDEHGLRQRREEELRPELLALRRVDGVEDELAQVGRLVASSSAGSRT